MNLRYRASGWGYMGGFEGEGKGEGERGVGERTCLKSNIIKYTCNEKIRTYQD